MVVERLKRALSAERDVVVPPPVLSFGSWERLPSAQVIQVCHPEWRGIRAATYAFGGPIVECADLAAWTPELISTMQAREVSCVIIQGWPSGAAGFAAEAARTGITVKAVLHSSPALQGASPAEAQVAATMFGLAEEGILAEVGVVKIGVAEAFDAIGRPVRYLMNRAPNVSEATRLDLGTGVHLGVFGEPWWPKNIATQALGAMLINDSVVHVNAPVGLGYLPEDRIVIHGVLERAEFLDLLGSVTLNLGVSMTECYPMLPMESYLLGVPCLISRTSSIFRSDSRLWDLTTVAEHDDPSAIAHAARKLDQHRTEALQLAREWVELADREADERWQSFVAG